ncbi:head maturation protease, ClpP-related [Pseudoclavibacter helvolus]|uniref:ATP-dependent Clp protease proteolytic subunit n=1 Tax=Pseudoclavibacter helvolus TaxID=255205 RepID=A0A7W4UM35_9MICO|nr:head maturation protease, ClpP-related [Pseudoclavibacter helvolus]MBB2956977.1 ATP-dependent protease ClpP protease subunit [Pseudoclavibacter helvolus]
MTAKAPGREDRPWFRIQAKADTEEQEISAADVYIYEEIGEYWGYGLGAKAFAQQIDALDVETINLYVNSPGGSAWDGIAIMNSLRRHKARVEVTVDGLAASAASLIAMAGDHITMNRGAELMIHDASGMAYGNAQTMDDTAKALHKLSDSYADTYAARAGGTREEWRALMQAETWYTAEEAVTAGLADEWADAPASKANFDLSKFAHAGRAHAPAPPTTHVATATEPSDTTTEGSEMTYETLKEGLRDRLGVTDTEATDEEILDALDEALDEQVDETTDESASAAAPAGTTLIDSEVLAQLQSDAQAGRTALDEQTRQRREGILATAIQEGRIAPASRASWLASLEQNEDTAKTLIASLPKNTMLPVAELGHTDETTTEADQLFEAAGRATKEN